MVLPNRTNSLNFVSFHRIAGTLFFVILLIYSIVYALERITYVDSAWLFFERVNGEKFSFPGDRYGAFFSEILVFLAAKLHLSFKVLVYVFSAGYIALYYVVWRMCTYTLKNPVAGLILIFGLVIGVRETFLHTVSETHQCFVYSALLFALIKFDFKKNLLLKNIFVCSTTILVLFTHPLGLFTSGFVLLYYFIEKRDFKEILIWLMGIIIISFGIWSFLHPANPYDATQISHLQHPTDSSSNIFDSHALAFLTMHFKHFYWLPELAGLIVFVWLIIKREWLKLVAVFFSVLVYLVIACITFYNGDASIMLERIFLPAFFMINLVLADLLFGEIKINKFIPMALVVFFMINGIHYINWGCLYYKQRVAYLDELVQKGIAQGNDVYFISDKNLDREKLLGHWALGAETLIYSKFKYNKCISISTEGEICDAGNLRVTSMLCLPVDELNQNYFHLSGKPYQELISNK